MSTRSTIKIKRKDGTETAIYCHFDGYIEGKREIKPAFKLIIE